MAGEDLKDLADRAAAEIAAAADEAALEAARVRYLGRKEGALTEATKRIAALPPNDLASSTLADELRARGAFRADVSGAGPTVYGLFHHRTAAEATVAALAAPGRRAWIAAPAWYV